AVIATAAIRDKTRRYIEILTRAAAAELWSEFLEVSRLAHLLDRNLTALNINRVSVQEFNLEANGTFISAATRDAAFVCLSSQRECAIPDRCRKVHHCASCALDANRCAASTDGSRILGRVPR